MYKRLLVLAMVVLGAASAAIAERLPYPEHEIANVAAFARLYGVARFFCPSDAAAELDWDRFAVHGVSKVRYAADQATLRNTLLRLFAPLGPGFEVSPRLPAAAAAEGEEPLVAWRYYGPGFAGNDVPGPYLGKRTNRAAPPAAIDGFVGYVQVLPAEALQGRTIRLQARVRATTSAETGGGTIALRIDRADKSIAFLDNMMKRPVRDAAWRLCTIETAVPADGFKAIVGAMAFGAATADFDAFELWVKGPDGTFSPVPIRDPGFEEPDETKAAPWYRTGTSRAAIVSRPEADAPEGRRFLRLAPPSRDPATPELVPDSPPVRGAHVDLDLGLGLSARVPLSIADGEARTNPARQKSLDALAAAIAAIAVRPESPDGPGPEQRLADVVVVWNVFRHFYPYWPEAGVEWEKRLVPALEDASAATSRPAQRDALRRLVADARDGHGAVVDPLDKRSLGHLPVAFALLGDRLAITASSAEDAPVGAVVTAIDGVPAARRIAELTRLQSGTDGWRGAQVAVELGVGPKGTATTLDLDAGSGIRPVTLSFDGTHPPGESRPGPVVEIDPGVWYVDLTRAGMSKVGPALEALAKARGVVFDLRGYPGDAGSGLLPHLLDTPETDRWMHVARIVGPFGKVAGWNGFGWDVAPAKPRIGGTVVFLTDARAISYAESVMGYVADHKLGSIVGSATAGTNGNVAAFGTPSGFRVSFTGMRVTGHDGKAPFHLVGVKPDVPVTPTVEGLRAGRDEVLERGLAIARATGNAPRGSAPPVSPPPGAPAPLPLPPSSPSPRPTGN